MPPIANTRMACGAVVRTPDRGNWFFKLVGWVPTVNCHFSPKNGCTDAVVREIARARSEVLVQAYSFTSPPIAQALLSAHQRGVRVSLLLDHSNEHETHTELPFLREKGLVPLIDSQHAIAHNKIIIIDRRTLITGSFNFTNQAEEHNAENLLVLRHHPDIVLAYRQNFLTHREHCRPSGSQTAVETEAEAADDEPIIPTRRAA